MKKRILILAQKILPDIGGIEKYIDNLILLFNKNSFTVDIYITDFINLETREKYLRFYPNINIIFSNNKIYPANEYKNKFYRLFYFIHNHYLKNKNLNKYLIKIQYDFIIDNTFFNFKKLRKNKKCCVIIHNDPSAFIMKYRFFDLFNLRKIFGFIIQKNLKLAESWKYYSNIILFNKKDKIIFENNKKFKKWQNIFYCYCSIKDYKSNFEYNLSGNIISILRFENAQKNLTFLDEVSKELDSKIHVYGDGDDKILFKNVIIHNKITDENEKYKLLSKSSLFIMTSNFEGLPFSIVEALSAGLSIIIRDTFLHAKTLVKDNYNGLVFDKNATPVEVANGIKELLKKPDLLKEMSKNSIKIFQENFEISNFNKSWEYIIKQLNK